MGKHQRVLKAGKYLHKKMDLLIAEQMKTLFDLQNAQVDLMEEIKEKLLSSAP